MHQTSSRQDILLSFLNTPLDCSDSLFQRFASLPGAIAHTGSEPLQRFVYLPGARKDRVVLVAHMDTVWDKSYRTAALTHTPVQLENGIIRSADPTVGIGADDRAGCAMLWLLRDCGHSILILDGEERGKRGAKFLRQSHRSIFRQLNRHRYMIELDWAGTNGCLYNQVENTPRFKKYIAEVLGFHDSKAKGGTDLQYLCRSICGVNLGIGYHGHHTPKECLVLSEWENTYCKLQEFLQKPQKRFHTRRLIPCLRFVKRCIGKVLRVGKGLFHRSPSEN